MSRRPARFTEADLNRALKAVARSGMSMAVEILADGTIRIAPTTAPAGFYEDHRPTARKPIDLGGSIYRGPGPAKPKPTAGTVTDWAKMLADWEKSIPGSPLNMLEQNALGQLKSYRVGTRVRSVAIKRCGPDTFDRLKLRGFIELYYREKFPDRVEGYILTTAGLNAAKVL